MGVGVLMLWVGVGVLVLAAREELAVGRESRESLRWPETLGEIVASDLTHYQHTRVKGPSYTCYRAKLRYRYEVAGRIYEGARVTVADGFPGTGSPADCRWATAHDIVEQYPLGRAVSVRYRPEDAAVSVLEPGSWGGGLLPYLLIGAAGLLAFFALKETVDWVRTSPSGS